MLRKRTRDESEGEGSAAKRTTRSATKALVEKDRRFNDVFRVFLAGKTVYIEGLDDFRKSEYCFEDTVDRCPNLTSATVLEYMDEEAMLFALNVLARKGVKILALHNTGSGSERCVELCPKLAKLKMVNCGRISGEEWIKLFADLGRSAVQELTVKMCEFGDSAGEFGALCRALGQMRGLRKAYLPIEYIRNADQSRQICRAIARSGIQELRVKIGSAWWRTGDEDAVNTLAEELEQAESSCELRAVNFKQSNINSELALLRLAESMRTDGPVTIKLANCFHLLPNGEFSYAWDARFLQSTIASGGRIRFEGINVFRNAGCLIEEALRAIHNYDTRNTTLAARCARQLAQSSREQTAMQAIAVRHALRGH